MGAWHKKNRKYCREYWKKYYAKNKKKIQIRLAAWFQNNKKAISERRRFSRYGLTKSEYNRILDKQKGKCAICRKKFVEIPRVDHCHKTNKNRGLLCNCCNIALGLFEDNRKVLRNAISYLAS